MCQVNQEQRPHCLGDSGGQGHAENFQAGKTERPKRERICYDDMDNVDTDNDPERGPGAAITLEYAADDLYQPLADEAELHYHHITADQPEKLGCRPHGRCYSP